MKRDVMIIDYADLMRSTERVEARHQELGEIYKELRGLAGEMKLPVWTASQTQKSSIQEKLFVKINLLMNYMHLHLVVH